MFMFLLIVVTVCGLLEWKRISAGFVFIVCICIVVEIPIIRGLGFGSINRFNTETEPGFQTPYVVVFLC